MSLAVIFYSGGVYSYRIQSLYCIRRRVMSLIVDGVGAGIIFTLGSRIFI